MKWKWLLACVSALAACAVARAGEYPAPREGDFVIKDFSFSNGGSLVELRMHYRTIGKVERDAQGRTRNAVLIMHGTTGSGGQFIRPEFADELFGRGQPLDAEKFFIILPDAIGHGGSSKPSDGLRAKFPRYGYRDMVEADRRLLTEGLGVDHLRLVMGTSMGGMHTWLWGGSHPEFADALLPLACLPTEIAGRNRVWRQIISDAIRLDPAWRDGDYETQPGGLRIAAQMLFLMSSNPVIRQRDFSTGITAAEALEAYAANAMKTMDANDVLYAIESSRDYEPGPRLEAIQAPLVAINFADDLINPPELGILEREIARVKGARAIVIPASGATRGHGTHTIAAVWKQHLAELLQESER